MIYKNYTPHDIVLFKKSGKFQYNSQTKNYYLADKSRNELKYEWKSLGVARCESNRESIPSPDGIPWVRLNKPTIYNLPEPEEGVLYIVSMKVARAAKELGRTDCVAPSKRVRDRYGKRLGCLGFIFV